MVNVEEGAELSLAAGDEANEFIYEAAERVEGVRDLCMESHYEYGTRRGWARIRKALKDHGVTATLNANGRALAYSPWIAEEAVADGHEVSAHGWRWERHVHMDEATERRAIARTVEAIAAAAGTPPVGWHTRSATSPNTRRLLCEQGGFLYDSNAYNDDCPFMAEAGGREIVVLPYAFDTNDMRFQPGGAFVHAEDFARYCIAAFDRLYAEGAEGPRMLSIGLHLRIIGRPRASAGSSSCWRTWRRSPESGSRGATRSRIMAAGAGTAGLVAPPSPHRLRAMSMRAGTRTAISSATAAAGPTSAGRTAHGSPSPSS